MIQLIHCATMLHCMTAAQQQLSYTGYVSYVSFTAVKQISDASFHVKQHYRDMQFDCNLTH